MSPRRKSGLSKDDLEALEHLPAVLRALEHLQEQHAKVRALMGGEAEKSAGYWRVMRDAERPPRPPYNHTREDGPETPCPICAQMARALTLWGQRAASVDALREHHEVGRSGSAHPMAGMDPSQLARGCAHGQLPQGADCPVCRMRGVGGPSLLDTVNRVQRSLDALEDLPADPAGRFLKVQQWIAEGRITWQVARRLLDFDPEDATRGLGPPTEPKSATLDTPERREYEEAKRAGRKVPVADPFANASPAQRERMAEQRAIIDAERAARGLPTRTVAPPRRPETLEEVLAAAPDEEVAVVRTETLDTVSDGTTPLASDADDEPEVH